MSATKIRIAIAGALGRMGQAVAHAAGHQVNARYDRPGAEAPGLVSRDDALSLSDVVIDFTLPAASVGLARVAALAGRPALVIGSTGFSEADEAAILAASARIPIVRSGNYSLGVNILTGLVQEAAKRLAAVEYDIEVFEAHHRRKVDAPSGTALMLAEAAAAGRGRSLRDVEVRARDGLTGPRPEGSIGFSVMRGGGIVGEHSVVFAAEDEILTMSHSARDRGLFARGAVVAANWIVGRKPGLYSMQDVLGFTDAG